LRYICGTILANLTAQVRLQNERRNSIMGLILLVLLIVLLLGAVPAWPYSRNWGYGPSGGLGLIVLIVIILLVLRVF
jgi:hypothetical protein